MIDEELIQKAIDGDKQAFIDIFDACEQQVFRTAYFILKDRQYAEDVVQDAFLQVYMKINKLESIEAFKPWLYKITVNTCSNFAKKLNKIRTVSIDEKFDIKDIASDSDFDIPENIIIRKDVRTFILQSIYSLPVKHRTVLTLFYYNGMNIREIAEILDCSEGTVKSRLFYSKKVLKKVLINNGIDILNHEREGGLYEA